MKWQRSCRHIITIYAASQLNFHLESMKYSLVCWFCYELLDTFIKWISFLLWHYIVIFEPEYAFGFPNWKFYYYTWSGPSGSGNQTTFWLEVRMLGGLRYDIFRLFRSFDNYPRNSYFCSHWPSFNFGILLNGAVCLYFVLPVPQKKNCTLFMVQFSWYPFSWTEGSILPEFEAYWLVSLLEAMEAKLELLFCWEMKGSGLRFWMMPT